MTATLTATLVEMAFEAHDRGETVDWPLIEVDDYLTLPFSDDATEPVAHLIVGIPGDLAPIAPLDAEFVIERTEPAPRVSFWRWLFGGGR